MHADPRCKFQSMLCSVGALGLYVQSHAQLLLECLCEQDRFACSFIMSIKGYVGCMFSGKTSSMQAEAERLERSGKSVIFLKHASDTRYDSLALVRSHNGNTRVCCVVPSLVASEIPADILLKITSVDVVCIDELQFMDGAVEFCVQQAEQGKHILFAALDGDFNMKPFHLVVELLPKCEKFKKLHAVCVVCGQRASFTRKIAGDPTRVIEVGGSELYVPTCRTHHHNSVYISNATIERTRAINERIMMHKSI